MSTVIPFPERATLNERVSDEVRALMGRHRVSQVALAGVLGVTQTQVSRRLHSKLQFTLPEIELLAAYFGVSTASLMGFADAVAGPGGDGGGTVTPQYAHLSLVRAA